MTNDHLNLKLLNFLGKLQVFKLEFLKFRILEILNFHQWMNNLRSRRGVVDKCYAL